MNFKSFYTESLLQRRPCYKWNAYLKQHGWQSIGTGSRAEVFGKPNKSYVIKIYERDPGYGWFLDFIESQKNNPHVVKISRPIHREEKGSCGVVAIERLDPLPQTKKVFFNLVYLLSKMLQKNTNTDELLGDNLDQYFENQVSSFITRQVFDKKRATQLRALLKWLRMNQPELLKTIIDFHIFLNKNMHNYTFDLHAHNFMIRPGTNTIVITDPIMGFLSRN